MFRCELKFVVDICKKWAYEKFMRKSLSLDLTAKTKFKNENKLCNDNPCVICGFDLGPAKVYGAKPDKSSYYDFTVKKEHHFLRNIFTESELKSCPSIQNLKSYYELFEKFMWISANLVTKKYSDQTDFENLGDPIMQDFKNECGFETFGELSFSISQHKVKNIIAKKKKKKKTQQLQQISFAYHQLFNFPGNEEEIKVFVSKNVLIPS